MDGFGLGARIGFVAAAIAGLGAILLGATLPPPLIVTFGDSLTAGHGVAQPQSYPAFLRADMARDHVPARVLNLGVSGDTTNDGLQRLPQVLALHPAWVVLEFGGNDGLRGLPVASTRANLQTMIVALRRAKIHVLLVGMTLPPNYGPGYIHAFQDIFPSLARQDHVPLLPFLYQDLVPRLRRDPGLLQPDGIHATARGNRIVAATVWRYLQPLLSS